MFRDFIVQNPNLFTDESLRNCLNAGFITQEDYTAILKNRYPKTEENKSPAENGGETGTTAD